LKPLLKNALHGLFLVLVFPMALLSGFGRVETMFTLWAQWCALVPGLVGDYLRIAYYRLTLEGCALESRIQFGSFFVHPQVTMGRDVYVGCYCVLGRTSIGERTEISSAVHILSGRHQHQRGSSGQLQSADLSRFEKIKIGSDCWIGAGAIVMADIGDGSTIGAGSVVTKPIPPGSVAVGSPARVIKSLVES
jgi:acetyltransferase-like isoleucine patch superfamily enzyme